MSTDAPPNADLLEAALGTAANVAPGTDAFAIDGLTPRYVVTPVDADGLASLLATANDAGAAVVPWGGGRHMALGNVPARYDIALQLASIATVLEHEPADLTATVEAGMTIGELASFLHKHGQFLPIDADPGATIGGVLATATGGPSRHAYGLPRDWLLGCRIAQADGTLVRGGGRVVKNVAGYDLPRLIVGSLGTLGVIVEATVKLAPLPAATETLLVSRTSPAAALADAGEAGARGLALTAIAVLDGATAARLAPHSDSNGWAVAYRIGGTKSAVVRTKMELSALADGSAVLPLEPQQAADFWSDMLAPLGNTELTISVPPMSVSGLIDLVPDTRTGIAAYPAAGILRIGLGEGSDDETATTVRTLRKTANNAGGSLVVNIAAANLKQEIDVWGDVDALAIMRRMKQEFDPKSTLNPGRFIGGI